MSPHDGQSRGGSSGRITETDVSRSRPVTVTVIDYDEARFSERTYTLPGGEIQIAVLPQGVTWIDVDGVHDTGVIQAVGDAVGIHPLTLEDIANARQRPKIEDYGDYLYVAVRMLAPGDGEFNSEQVSLVLGRGGYVVSFQEQPGDVFERIRERCVREQEGSEASGRTTSSTLCWTRSSTATSPRSRNSGSVSRSSRRRWWRTPPTAGRCRRYMR